MVLALVALLISFWLDGRHPRLPAKRSKERAAILACGEGDPSSIAVTSAGATISGERKDGRWIGGAASAFADLGDALCTLPIIDRIPTAEHLAAFGLETPRIMVRVVTSSGIHTLQIGDTTPAGNFVYARDASRSEILKLGEQVRSEVAKVLLHSRGRGRE
jgi:hypothetical protein